MTSKLGAARVQEVEDRASFTSFIQVVFAQMFDIDVSMSSVGSVEVTYASAVLIVFSAAGIGLSVSTNTEGSTQMTGLSNQEFVSEGLSYTVSSVSANVAEDFSVTLEPGAASAEKVAALVSFTIPLTESTCCHCSCYDHVLCIIKLRRLCDSNVQR